MYRGYRKQIFYNLGFDTDRGFVLPERLFRTRASIEPALSMRAARRRLRLAEIPGDEPARIGGTRKLQIIRWGLAFLFQEFAEIFRK